VLTSVTWATIFFGLLAMAALAVVRRRRSRSAP
jgi:MYXO-CTERM domain-containing protein